MDNTIYVGKYKVPKGGVIPLPKSRLRVLNFYVGTGKHGAVKDDRLTLIVEDGDFWPVICKLDDREAEELIKALEIALSRRSQVWETVE